MAEKEVPRYRCTVCLHELTAKDEQPMFGAETWCPPSDAVELFVADAQRILHYASAVALLQRGAEFIGKETVHQVEALVGELVDESLRRLDRAQEALRIVWERHHDKETGEPKDLPCLAKA